MLYVAFLAWAFGMPELGLVLGTVEGIVRLAELIRVVIEVGVRVGVP
jgi:hypothetical protein